jgi:hypothetical protein
VPVPDCSRFSDLALAEALHLSRLNSEVVMFYELIPILIFLGIGLAGGVVLIADGSIRIFRDIQVTLRNRMR